MKKSSWFSMLVESNFYKHSGLKLFLFLMVVGLPKIQANAYSQFEEITLHIENKTIKQVLVEIESKSQFKFFYKTDEIDLERKVSINVDRMPVDKILEQVFDDGTVSFSTIKNQIVLKKAEPKPAKTIKPDIRRETQEANPAVSVSGKVSDEQGVGIPGVSVIEKGTSNGVATDVEGGYSIDVDSPNSTLVFSSIGYITQEIRVGAVSSLNVSMVEDIQSLNEIVVLGYASQSKEDLTGAVSSLKSEDIKNLPVTSAAELLQGRVAGVQVVKSSGAPGATSDIVVRGGGSVNGMSPLFIVDGVRMGTNYSFNSEDIESMEILKDASAAAIYGAQAAGGVVLIQTKRGSGNNEKININVSGYSGIRNTRPLVPLMNTQQMFAARKAFGYDVSAWGDPNTLPDVDWVDELYNPGNDNNYTVSLAGSSQKANYYLSGNIFKQKGIKLDNSFERYSFRTNSDFHLSKNVTVGETVYLYKSYLNPDQGGNYWRTVPTMPVYEPDGSWGQAPSAGYFNGNNPALVALTNHGGQDEFAIQSNAYVDIKIMDGLNLRGTLGANIGSSVNSIFSEAYNIGSQSAPAIFTETYTDWENYTANLVASYEKMVGDHSFKALAGYEMYKEDRKYVTVNATNFVADVTESFFLNNDVTSQRVTGGPSPDQRLLSQFGRINYSYAGKYLASATIRRDGSDRFGPANKWGVFPAFSAGWRISEEGFFDQGGFISSMQLRASYGALGNIGAIPQYLYQVSYSPQNFHALGDGRAVQSYSRALSLANTEIKWEEVKTTDFGVDFGLLDQRLTVTMDWYKRLTSDMIYQLPLPMSSGYVAGRLLASNPVFTNIGELSNTGLEIGANYEQSVGDLQMNFGLTGAFNKNKVVSLDGSGTKSINDGVGGQYLSNSISRTVDGQPMSQFFGYVVEGIFATDQEAQERGVVQEGAGAGDLIYKDVNGDGVITQDDRDFIGNPWPKLNFGININMKYRGFDLALAFQGVSGVDLYNANRHYSDFLAGDYNSSPEVFKASFFDGNGLTSVPRLGFTDVNGNYQRDPNANYTNISSYFVENGSYLKLRNLQFGYSFPIAALSNIKVSALRIYLMADNFLTFTKYKGVDPEVLGEGTVGSRGIDFNSRYPQTTFVSAGFNLSF
ncbi:TonB-dependent receptor [Imperialibacter roseus]|uniref:TonB-dependent receptor n=1 Tax=Imperialibacter roseus TaxID=1324217 RepID=A0ABZ0IXP4_9BACT|nr:TonB-dependent receptor [Imperialibacter roseus]WOK08436.1 TonB-dependent receptor [Imperialibacter roseus]